MAKLERKRETIIKTHPKLLQQHLIVNKLDSNSRLIKFCIAVKLEFAKNLTNEFEHFKTQLGL